MSAAARTVAAWSRIEEWLGEHLPGALENLRPPASEERLARLEASLGRPVPSGMQALLRLHDGEERSWPPGVLPDGHWLLPCDQIEAMWLQLGELAAEGGQSEDAPASWRAQVEDGIVFVKGAVKPNFGSPAWIPFSSLEGHVQRFVDLDPAPGGTVGQVIEVDPEGCTWQVLAPSFADFLEGYADGLEGGAYRVEGEALQSERGGVVDPTEWGLPDYLARSENTAAEPSTDAPGSLLSPTSADVLEEEEEVVLQGRMGMLMGGPEIIFSIETADGAELSFLASAALTKGYRTIRVEQQVRVRARRYTPDTPSVFVDMGTEAPDFVALEYTVLRS